MLGSHAVARQETADGEDSSGTDPLEEGEAGVRVGHFLAGAPAVDVRLVPEEGGDGAVGTDDSTGTDEEDDGTGSMNETTEEDESLQQDTETNESDDGMSNESDDGMGNESDDGLGGTDTETGTSDDDSVAENVAYGEVSEYASVAAGAYTVQVVESSGETTDDAGTDTTNDTDDTDSEDAESDDDIISLPPDLENETPDSSGGNESGSMGNESGSMGNESENDTMSVDEQFQQDNESDDGLGSENESDDTTDVTDDGGTTDTDSEEVLYETEITVGETFDTAAVAGNFDEDDVQVLALRDYDAAQVRLVHVSSDAPAVDVVAPDASMTLFDGVSFGQATEYVGVPPGSYSLSVREAARMNDGDEVGTFDAEFDSGEAYSVFATGSPEGGAEEFELVVDRDGQGADAGLGSGDAPGQQEPGAGGPGGNESDDGLGSDNESSGMGNESGDMDNESGDMDNESEDEEDDGILSF
jgi:hypothetical protein